MRGLNRATVLTLLSSKTDGIGEPRRILAPLCQHAHKYSTKLELPAAGDHCNLVTQPFQIFETTKLWIWQRVPWATFSEEPIPFSHRNSVLATTHHFRGCGEVCGTNIFLDYRSMLFL